HSTSSYVFYSLSLHDALPILIFIYSIFQADLLSTITFSRQPYFLIILSKIVCLSIFLVQKNQSLHSIPSASLSIRSFATPQDPRSEEHTSELQSRENLVCRLL